MSKHLILQALSVNYVLRCAVSLRDSTTRASKIRTHVQDNVRVAIIEFPIVLFWPICDNKFLKTKKGYKDCFSFFNIAWETCFRH